MPKLWNETIDAHRREVTTAILDATATLIAAQGLRAVTMSEIAGTAGIGRATLYKYFPDVESILIAWHERQVAGCLARLTELRDSAESSTEKLNAVLGHYAFVQYGSRRSDLAAVLHRQEHIGQAQQKLGALIGDLLVQGVDGGVVRTDVPPSELAAYCLHALSAARDLTDESGVRRLVAVTLAGLRPAG